MVALIVCFLQFSLAVGNSFRPLSTSNVLCYLPQYSPPQIALLCSFLRFLFTRHAVRPHARANTLPEKTDPFPQPVHQHPGDDLTCLGPKYDRQWCYYIHRLHHQADCVPQSSQGGQFLRATNWKVEDPKCRSCLHSGQYKER